MNKAKIKILFVIPTLTAGGAQRIMAFLSKNLDKSIFETTLVVVESDENSAYDVSDMDVRFLGKDRVLSAVPNIIEVIRKFKPSVVMSAITHLNIAMGCISILFPKITFVGRQTNISKISFSHNNAPKKKFNFFSWFSFGLNKLDYIVCQSSDMAKDCQDAYNIGSSKIKIIRNPITDKFELLPTSRVVRGTVMKFLTVGRLTQIKGHERLLEVLSNLELPFEYKIIGDGPKKAELLAQVSALNLADKVKFVDFTSNVAEFLRESDYFLQGSYAEGFPNAVLESCAVGTPVIAFDVPGGTKEIIESGKNGFLVQDENEFLSRLSNLPTFDPKNVSDSVFKKFDKKIILEDYASFFQEVVTS